MSVLGTGVDIVEVERIRKAEKRWGNRFLKKIFTERELEYSFKKAIPWLHLAVRFAAKEACFKALDKKGQLRAGWQDMEVRSSEEGKPYISFKGKLKDLLSRGEKVHLSLSHTSALAIAYVVRSSE